MLTLNKNYNPNQAETIGISEKTTDIKKEQIQSTTEIQKNKEIEFIYLVVLSKYIKRKKWLVIMMEL